MKDSDNLHTPTFMRRGKNPWHPLNSSGWAAEPVLSLRIERNIFLLPKIAKVYKLVYRGSGKKEMGKVKNRGERQEE
jgi:hypothetical protein